MMESLRASVTVQQVIVVCFVTKAFSNPPSSARFLLADGAVIIGFVIWVRLVLSLNKTVFVPGLPFLVEGKITCSLCGSLSPHF
jgi:hypothetical protein